MTSQPPGPSPRDPWTRPTPPPYDPDMAPSIDDLPTEEMVVGPVEDEGRPFWVELPFLVLVALLAAVLIKTFVVQAFYIPSESMEDTLQVGDRVMVSKFSYRFGEPSRFDVVVFESPNAEPRDENLLQAIVRNIGESLGVSSPDTVLIKRVIGLPGDEIRIDRNRLFVNEVEIDEPYLKEGVRMRDYGPVTVPEGHYFLMGDNRSSSVDSRRFGPVDGELIIGRAFVRVWPPSRWGGL